MCMKFDPQCRLKCYKNNISVSLCAHNYSIIINMNLYSLSLLICFLVFGIVIQSSHNLVSAAPNTNGKGKGNPNTKRSTKGKQQVLSPTGEPTGQPSGEPSSPSEQPTAQPSAPSGQPTGTPSAAPNSRVCNCAYSSIVNSQTAAHRKVTIN